MSTVQNYMVICHNTIESQDAQMQKHFSKEASFVHR